MKLTYLITLIIALFTACKKDERTTNPTIEGIYGRWQLVEEVSGLNGARTTPTDEFILEYTRSGYCRVFKNATLVSQDKFIVELGISIFSEEPGYQIVYKNSLIRQNIMHVSADTLHIAIDAFDGGSAVYVKIR